jgi:hypothetical protein
MYKIMLTSDEYGEEFFKYNTRKEAKKAFSRLALSSHECTKEDGITRSIYLIIESKTFFGDGEISHE